MIGAGPVVVARWSDRAEWGVRSEPSAPLDEVGIATTVNDAVDDAVPRMRGRGQQTEATDG